jgi:hypothetical protein
LSVVAAEALDAYSSHEKGASGALGGVILRM